MHGLVGIAGSNPAKVMNVFVSCECWVLSGSLCDGLITRMEELYELLCVKCVWSWGPGELRSVAPRSKISPEAINIIDCKTICYKMYYISRFLPVLATNMPLRSAPWNTSVHLVSIYLTRHSGEYFYQIHDRNTITDVTSCSKHCGQ